MTDRAAHDALATQPLPFAPGLFGGQVVLVSGGGTGLGRAMAYRFGRLGARLVICGRHAPPLEETAAGLRALDIECLTVPMTIRDPQQVAALFDAAWGRFGRLDVLVNNAGGQFAQAAIDFSVKGWNAVIDTNLNGTWYMMQQAAQRWRDAGTPGSIVNIVLAVDRGVLQQAHSCAARAGVIHLSKTVAVEWAPYRIRVNCVAPGVIASSGLDHYAPEAVARFRRANPMLRMGEPADVADACCYLAGPTGKFITGEVLTVDGGQQMWGEQWAVREPDWFEARGTNDEAARAQPRGDRDA